MEIRYRHLEKEDNKSLAELIRSVFREFGIARPGTVYFDPTTDDLFALFSTPGSEYWIAEDDGIQVGSLLITYEWSDWRNSRVWWFQSVYVIPDYRRKGIFRSMYNHIKDEADKQNIAGLRLYVETNNTRAQRTYEALGMQNEHYTMFEWMKE